MPSSVRELWRCPLLGKTGSNRSAAGPLDKREVAEVLIAGRHTVLAHVNEQRDGFTRFDGPGVRDAEALERLAISDEAEGTGTPGMGMDDYIRARSDIYYGPG